jgi:hypothetical protein
MGVWIVSTARRLAALVRDFIDGLAVGLVAIWIFRRLINGVGAMIVIGILVLLVH